MQEEFEAGKWKVFLVKDNVNERIVNNLLTLRFRLKDSPSELKPVDKEDIEELFLDLQDLSKWRKFKELKKDLEN